MRLQRKVDRETKSDLTIRVEAIDNGTPQMTSQTDLTIKVIDVNDVTPAFRPVVIEPVLEVCVINIFLYKFFYSSLSN